MHVQDCFEKGMRSSKIVSYWGGGEEPSCQLGEISRVDGVADCQTSDMSRCFQRLAILVNSRLILVRLAFQLSFEWLLQ